MTNMPMEVPDAQVVGQFHLLVGINIQDCVWPIRIRGQDPNVTTFRGQVTTELINGFNGTTIDMGRIKCRDNVEDFHSRTWPNF